MKKALQDEQRGFFTAIDGQIRMQSAVLAEVLIEAANKFLEKSDFEKNISISELHFFEQSIYLWMSRLVKEGVTNKLIDDLNKVLSTVRFRHILMPPKGELPYWEHIADIRTSFGPQIKAAYAFSQQLALGSLVELKRCQMPNCQKFFIGRPGAQKRADHGIE
jgi:hypothetical protein